MISDCRRRIKIRKRSKNFFKYDSDNSSDTGEFKVGSPKELLKQGFFQDRKS